MWIRHVILAFLAFLAGVGVSAGTFAFILVIGVVPRILRRTNLAKRVLLVESMISAGGIIGNMLSVFYVSELFIWQPAVYFSDSATGMLFRGAGHLLIAIYGICAGMFVGCISVALAEILNTFPILFKRLHLKLGLQWVMLMMALGKSVGAFFYFVSGYSM